MTMFSERNGYTKPNNVIIAGRLPKEIANAICNWYVNILRNIKNEKERNTLEITFWTKFLNEYSLDCPVLMKYKRYPTLDYWQDSSKKWYKKLDALEFICSLLKKKDGDLYYSLEESLNKEFERLNYGYRVVGGCVVEVTNKEEINAILETLTDNDKGVGVKTHIESALKLLSPSQSKPDYRNSIKESISAVECYCRELTGQKTLDSALKHLTNKGITLNSQMKKGFENLYYYTNDAKTGVRHALMDEKNLPSADEAVYMLVVCSAFINYLSKKKSQITSAQSN